MIVPEKVVKQLIYKILIQKRNELLIQAEELQEKEMLETGCTSNFSGDFATEASGIGVLADDILCGDITVAEALKDILNKDEKEQLINMCKQWAVIQYHNSEKRER